MLETELCGLKLKNPLILASGVIWHHTTKLSECAKNNAGAIITKTIMNRERTGHPHPQIAKWECGYINAVGLPSPGYKNMETEWKEMQEIQKHCPLIASIGSDNAKEYSTVANFVAQKKPNAIEVNLSCPNVEGKGAVYSANTEEPAVIIKEIKKKTNIPIIAKITPATANPLEVAKACEKAGADAITAANTMPGMIIDIQKHKPVISFKKGGISGHAIKPVAMKIVYELFEETKTPIIASGGAMNAHDCIEFIQAGATCVQLGSAVIQNGTKVFTTTQNEIKEWMQKNNYKKISEIKGIAHE
jgi:dihydroorotate dehydrogenase (NAD+) catalytic subunit